jgi:hypothetical protein
VKPKDVLDKPNTSVKNYSELYKKKYFLKEIRINLVRCDDK